MKKKLFYLLFIALTIVLSIVYLIKHNDKKDNITTITPTIDENKEPTIQEKYDKAMSLMEENEKEAIKLLKEIPDFKDSKTYIDNYDFRHRFDGTYFSVYRDDVSTAIEKSPSWRMVINGLNQNSNITKYQYNLHDMWVNGTTYYKGRFNTYQSKLICDESLSICKEIILQNGEDTFDENAENIYRIFTYVFSENLINVNIHYITKKYNYDEDSTFVYKKISDEVELPPERQETKYPEEPKIGMTKAEVRKSTWGYPDKINKSYYSWGTREQWVYDRGYIYFSDNIVTSISEKNIEVD